MSRIESELAATREPPLPVAATNTPAPPPATPVPSPTATTRTRALDDGWTLYEKAGAGFGIALPPGWWYLDLEHDFEGMVEQLRRRDPDAAIALEGQARSAVAAGVAFYAFDTGPEAASSGYLTTLNILASSTRSRPPLDYAGLVNATLIESLPNVVKPVVRERVKIVTARRRRSASRSTWLWTASRRSVLHSGNTMWLRLHVYTSSRSRPRHAVRKAERTSSGRSARVFARWTFKKR